MKPSNEEKLRFFGSHIGCEVEFKTQTGSRRGTLIGVTENSYHVKDSKGVVKYIDHELVSILFRPLSSISEEDAIKLGRVVAKYIASPNGKFGDDYYAELGRNHGRVGMKLFDVVDRARSLGIAVDFDGHTVEQMISYGWIKLKE